MVVAFAQDRWILLVRRLHHVSEKDRVDAVILVSAGLVEGHDHQRPLPKLLGKGFIQELLHPGARNFCRRVMAVVIRIRRIEGIRNQPLLCVLDKKIVRLGRVDPNHAIAPFFLYFLKTQERDMTPHVVAAFVGDMQAGNLPRTVSQRKLLRILLEVEAGSEQAVGNGFVQRIVGEIHLLVPQKASPAVQAEIRPRDHREIVRIRRMKQSVKVRKTRSL